MPEGARGEAVESRVGARVLEILPRGLFRVELLTETRPQVTAHVSGSSNLLRILPGENVVVELMPYDPTRGRIVKRAE
jgi:translation initiation factor IF-1